MTMHDYKRDYLDAGFFWNGIVERMALRYAGKQFEYRHPISGEPETVSFFYTRKMLGPLGRRLGQYERLAEYFKEDVIPVGDTCRGHTQLHLCESGRLFGFADCLLLQWGPDPFWETQIEVLLQGLRSTEIGLLDD
jgi:hypothetical protein